MIFFIQYLAEPAFKSKDKGAYINCWVNAANESAAKELCTKIITSKKWKVINNLHTYTVSKNFYKPDTEGYEFYKQALTEDCVIVFYTWLYSSAKEAKAAKDGKKVRIKLEKTV